MFNKPLYIVDMTLFEFVHIMEFINDVIVNFSEVDRKKQLWKKIYNMFGKIPIDKGKQPRNLSGAKDKITSNFLITINQLGFLDNNNDFKELYNSLRNNRDIFFKKLRQLLLVKGNWNIYIKSMENVNRNRKFKNKKEYIYQVAQDLFMKIPNISENGHKKRLSYVLKWMRDDQLKIIGDFTDEGIIIF